MRDFADKLEFLFKSGTPDRLGMGSRRACYRLPGESALCVKCYRSDEEILEGRNPERDDHRPLTPAVVREIRKYRHNGRFNTCCREYRYWKAISRRVPAGTMRHFPSSIELVHTPSRGWCLLEELILNDDGSPVVKFHVAWRSAAPDLRRRLLSALTEIEETFVRHAIRFFDPQTIMVQTTPDGFALRLPDFEPVARTLIPLDTLLPFLIPAKIRRRFHRYRSAYRIGEAFIDTGNDHE